MPIACEISDQEVEPVRKRMPLLSHSFSILAPEIAEVLGVKFPPDIFEEAERAAKYDSDGKARWRLESIHGFLEVTFEYAEGYLFGHFEAVEPYFSQGEAILLAANADYGYVSKP